MHKTMIITYDLKKPGRNYDALYKAIKALGSWAKPAESVWVVTGANLTAASVRDNLRAHVDANDVIVVLDVSVTDWGAINMPTEVTDWFRKSL